MKIQKELDETKITLHKTIESVLERVCDQNLEASGVRELTRNFTG